MKKILELITDEIKKAFAEAGFNNEKVTASISNRPDLCEYQCNGAMVLSKTEHKAPIEIANSVVQRLKDNTAFSEVSAVNPGFINLTLSEKFITDYINEMNSSPKFGLNESKNPIKIMVDYGGANVAKPLHIGHLRSAIIGESIKRICNYMGHDAIGDVHLGDWGLQMGQVIAEINERGLGMEFTVSDLEEIYPAASKKCKPESDTYNADFAALAHKITGELQDGNPEYRRIWEKILEVSKEDLKKNYDSLNVHFELWKGESDVQPYIPDMLKDFKEKGYARESMGAWVIDVTKDSDKKELPPCIVIKSDGSSLYATTDLATLVEREKLFKPDYIIYVVDKRQSLHLEQVFRASKKTGIVHPEMELFHLGFGTMNGKDGQPYKTRSGGVMRLESLIKEVNEAVFEKMKGNPDIDEDEAKETAEIIALAALKYGDLSNQATKDYIFDLSRFIEFEGNTGPYILYTIVRIKSILSKADAAAAGEILFTGQPSEKTLMIELSKFNDVIENAYNELAPHKICAYIYEIANAFNGFYHEVKIISESDSGKKDSYLRLLELTKKVLEKCIDLLGFSAPDRM